jgi:exodeoxyribonuclease-3
MKIATWNVNGIRARQAEVQEWLERDQPDVVCLQEIKASIDQLPVWLCEMEGYWCYWHGGKGYSGVGLHVSKRISPDRPAFEHPAFDYENRIVLVRLPAVTIVSVYVPNGGKDFPAKMQFLGSLEQFAAGMRAETNPVVICGDLNIARTDMDVHPKERKPRAIGQLPEERALLERLIAHGLVDVGRALEPDNDQMFTWWAPWRNMRQRNIGWRLDYLLASQSLFERVRSCGIERETGTSDHAPVVGDFAL